MVREERLLLFFYGFSLGSGFFGGAYFGKKRQYFCLIVWKTDGGE